VRSCRCRSPHFPVFRTDGLLVLPTLLWGRGTARAVQCESTARVHGIERRRSGGSLSQPRGVVSPGFGAESDRRAPRVARRLARAESVEDHSSPHAWHALHGSPKRALSRERRNGFAGAFADGCGHSAAPRRSRGLREFPRRTSGRPPTSEASDLGLRTGCARSSRLRHRQRAEKEK
jgi:hypothetical protein